MKKITLIGLLSDENRIIDALCKAGAVEIVPPEEGDSSTLNAELYSEYEQAIERLDSTLKTLSKYKKKPGLLEPLPEVEEERFYSDSLQSDAAKVYSETLSLSETLDSLEMEIKQLQSKIKLITPFTDYTGDLADIKSTKKTYIAAYSCPRREIAALGEDIAYEIVSETRDTLYLIVACDKGEGEKAIPQVLSRINFYDGLKGSAKDNIAALNDTISGLNKKKAETITALREQAKAYDTVAAAKDALCVSYDRLCAMGDMLSSDSSFLLRGWIRSDEKDKAISAIESVTQAYFLDVTDPEEGDEIPSVVNNKPVPGSFEAIVDMYSRPHPTEDVDPAPLITPFYMLFFAMMLADTGYGLILFLALLIFEKKKKPRGAMQKLVGALKWSGLATIAIGFLFGTFFGMDFDIIFGTHDVFPLIMDPLRDSMNMLYLTCGLGLLHMFFGLGVKMYICIKHGDLQSAIYDNLSWILLVSGLVAALIIPAPYKTVAWIVALVGGALLLIFGGRDKKGIMRIFGGFGKLYNVTGYLSDTVSYARIFAIGLVGGAMGDVFNTIGKMVASGGHGAMHFIMLILAGILLAVLHVFGLLINTLSAFSHTVRLQFVEFFGKFYTGGGREFKPLKVDTKNVVVKTQKQ